MRIAVGLRDAPYEVDIGEGVRHEVSAFVAQRFATARMAVILTSPQIRRQSWFDIDLGIETRVIEVDDGESAKTLATVQRVCEELAQLRVSRHDLIVGVGGGAMTDLAGFIAAVYLRGLAVLHLPTSVVGQVDAAIGGKTAVNIAAGKNLVGSFHQPSGVWCDTATLATLDERERRSGMGEVAKCWLLEARSAASLASTSLEEFIEIAVALKARIVVDDEFETSGLLNYGHTLGHAIEALALARDPDELRHGEAVSIGLAFAARLARRLGRVDERAVAETEAVIDHFALPRRLSRSFAVDDLMEVMARDKKAHHDLAFVLDGERGCELVTGIDPDVVRDELEDFQEA